MVYAVSALVRVYLQSRLRASKRRRAHPMIRKIEICTPQYFPRVV